MPHFRNLAVWREAHALLLSVYRQTARFTQEELYGLRSQMRHAAVSITANLAEGSARGSDADFARFVRYSRASASELQSHLILARDLGLLDLPTADGLSNHLARLMVHLTRLLARIAKK